MNKILHFTVILVAVCAVSSGMTACRKGDHKGLLGIVVPVGQEKVRKDAPYVITGVYEGSPAYRAGLRPDDRIVQIDGKELDGLEYDHIYNTMLRGPAGTTVTIVVERKGETLVFDVVRGE
ncbi:MAG TPA: PDZ domain-containing protein [Spirochaetota bacterium]|nr:PDZ domain-containing protein [Spirochaetota bacterium]HPC41644.1 PDZ domain-containing protein [Spirochaetota bacterium]HPL16351.1 PDZ domain-containing protein [Spirochaetota bacterium]HQF09331.1 PDZ domain-containing protein [Spirochaetota bacterium]HQH98279.1 PDZ domain-containing protein [Spirochaetota bacterium]